MSLSWKRALITAGKFVAQLQKYVSSCGAHFFVRLVLLQDQNSVPVNTGALTSKFLLSRFQEVPVFLTQGSWPKTVPFCLNLSMGNVLAWCSTVQPRRISSC